MWLSRMKNQNISANFKNLSACRKTGMKVGIITLPLQACCGRMLQAYALQSVLEDMGHDAVLLDRTCPDNRLYRLAAAAGRSGLKSLRKLSGMLMPGKRPSDWRIIPVEYAGSFISRYIRRLPVEDYMHLPDTGYDALIAGAGPVWNPDLFTGEAGAPENAFLRFAGMWRIRRIAYAASFGTDRWGYSGRVTKNCAALAGRFDVVSVSTMTDVGLCDRYLDVKASLVLDPMLLLEEDRYMQLAGISGMNEDCGRMTVFVSSLSSWKKSFIDRLAAMKGMTTFNLGDAMCGRGPLPDDCPSGGFRDGPVEGWLKCIAGSGMVVTDSVYACFASIIFRRQFIALSDGSSASGSIGQLLSLLGLENRIVHASGEYSGLPDIDYDEVYVNIGMMRRRSLDFLKSVL